MQDGSDEEKSSTINTLYASLDGGLTMIHPFMPFLSEELWQRLPRREDDSTISIVKARYPRFDSQFDDTEAAKQYGLLLDCSKALRSLMSEFGIKKDASGNLTFQI